MKKISYLSLSLLLVGLCNSCKSSHGELTRRYKSAALNTNIAIDNYVTVQGYATDIEKPDPPKPLNLYQLPENVLIKVVDVLGDMDANSAALITSLSSPLKLKKPEEEIQYLLDDRTKFKKRIVFSISNESAFPGDRIWKLTIGLTDNAAGGSPVRFVNSDVLVSQFVTTDVGKLAYNRKNTFTANLGAETGGSATQNGKTTSSSGNQATTQNSNEDETAGTSSSTNNGTTGGSTNENSSSITATNKATGSLSYYRELSSNEEVMLKQRYVKLSGSVKEHSLSLYQESTSGIDLSGNVSADVEFGQNNAAVIATPTFEFYNLKAAAAYNPVAQVKLKMIVVAYPNVAAGTNIVGTISFKGVVRTINKHDNTIAESDDEVTFIKGTSAVATETVTILTDKEMIPNLWHINNSAGSSMQIQTAGMAAPIDLQFRTFEDAQNFILWLKENNANIIATAGVVANGVHLSMGTGGGALNAANINLTYIRKN